MKKVTWIVCLLFCSIAQVWAAEKVVVAYVTSWTQTIPDPTVMTHINYAFGHVNETFDGVRIDNPDRLRQMVDLKAQNPKLKVMLSVGGWGSGRFSEMAASDATRLSFAKDCRRVVDEFGLDGIDIDWEYPTQSSAKISSSPDDTKNFTLLMRDLRQQLGDKILSCATVASAEYIDFRSCIEYLDLVNVMSYDMADAPKHHSALYPSDLSGQITTSQAVDAHLKAGVPREKLVMGMPLYGRGRQGYRPDRDSTNVLTECWHSQSLVPYLINEQGEMVLGYENERSIGIKCQYILDHQLRGGMYWEYGNERQEKMRNVIARALIQEVPQDLRQRVLVIAELGGQHGAFTQTGLAWLRQQAAQLGFYIKEVNDCRELKVGDIASYDLVVQLNYPPYMWSEASIKEFEQAIDRGSLAWIGFHHASLLGEFDGFEMWPWFSDFLGGIRFQNYIAEKADGEMTVEDPGHPVMSGVHPTFVIREDEWYTYDRNPRPNVHVLASVDENTYRPASNIKMGDHPVVWTNLSKPARNVYFQIGHSASLFENPDFVRMFTNALLWGLNRPMKCYSEQSLEASLEAQPVLATKKVQDALVLTVPVSTGQRATGNVGDPDYAIYGTRSVTLPLAQHDLTQWNRLSFDVRTDLDAGVANVNVAMETSPYSGLGAHLVNIQGQDWQHVVYQIDELPRENVTGIRIYTDIKGRNLSKLDTIHYEIRNIQLEKVSVPEQVSGWQVAPGQIAYSMSGYLPAGNKTAVVAGKGGTFQLIDELTHKVVYEGRTTMPATTLGTPLSVIDFSVFRQEGIYRLVAGSLQTAPFPISSHALDGTMWKVLNYIRCQRCGDEVAGVHGKCHTDVFCDHEGQSYTYGGGWHDAGDLSQQTLQTGDVAFALLEASQACKNTNPQLSERLLEEARYGLKQIVNTRMGNGWRASSIGLLHWTDGIIGTPDDIHSVRKQHIALDNYLYAAYEAYAAMLLKDEGLKRVAIEDFHFADEQYQREGIDTFKITMEHTYNTSAATWMAAASWSASMLYQLTGDGTYAEKAASYIDYTIDCQEQKGDFAGYFYRDKSRKAIVHYIHQSRELLPVQALVALCESQPQHAQYAKWHHAIELYGQYLKQVVAYTQPYGMAPSGIYQPKEYEDEDGFNRLHLWAPDNARELYDTQLQEGVKIDERHYIRRFPIWFSIFNGNEAIVLSTGKAAACCGRFLHDEALLNIGREQLYWTVGKNPLCQSLIYGEGHRYPSQDSFSSGELVGEIPVGIRSLGNADIPYFPMTNNACYKEVWLTSAGKWLSLLADLMTL